MLIFRLVGVDGDIASVSVGAFGVSGAGGNSGGCDAAGNSDCCDIGGVEFSVGVGGGAGVGVCTAGCVSGALTISTDAFFDCVNHHAAPPTARIPAAIHIGKRCERLTWTFCRVDVASTGIFFAGCIDALASEELPTVG